MYCRITKFCSIFGEIMMRKGTITLMLGIVMLMGKIGNASLIAHWDMEEGSGLTAADISGGNDGAIDGAAWVATDLAGIPGGTTAALSFDGSNDQVVATGYKGISSDNPRTVACWVKISDWVRRYETIVSWGSTDVNGKRFCIRPENSTKNTGAVRVEVQGGFSTGAIAITDGNWHHVAVTFDGSVIGDVKIYVDGVSDSNSANGQAVDTGADYDVHIGNSIAFENRYLNGCIDDVRIYDEALSASAVAALVPEPATITLLGIGCLSMLNRRRKM